MKILSLFDGMGCGAIAFTKLGMPIDRYVAYEIDKYAVQATSHNFPYIEQCGDVFKADFAEYIDFDWVIGGSPCTYWSIAQKNNRETEASGLGWELFSQYVRAVKEAKPKYFLYENNKSMSKEIRASIDKAFGFEAVGINSALVSAQNRQRLYWVGKRNTDGTYSKVDVKQPEDKGILLRDILDNAVAWREKSYCIDANYYKGGNLTSFTKQNAMRFMAAEPVCVAQRGRYTENGKIVQNYEPREDGKTNAITTVQKDNAVAEPIRVGDLPNSDGHINGSQAMRIYAIDGKSVNLVAGGGGMGGKTGLYAVPFNETVDGKPYALTSSYYKISEQPISEFGEEIRRPRIVQTWNGESKPVYEVLNGLITIKDKQYPIKLADGYYIIRKLTVGECKRLQTVPEWYDFSVISNSQAYKCLGNGWTVDVIAWLLSNALSERS